MTQELKPLKVDRSKLITQTEYAKLKKITPQRVNQLVKENKVNHITILGAVLILLD